MLGQGPPERGWGKGVGKGRLGGADRGPRVLPPDPLPLPPGSERLVGVSEFSVLVVTPASGREGKALRLGVRARVCSGRGTLKRRWRRLTGEMPTGGAAVLQVLS